MRKIGLQLYAMVGFLAYGYNSYAQKTPVVPLKSNCLSVISRKADNIIDLLKSMPSPRQSYTVALSQPPPVRVRASIDSTSGQHIELEWDPNQTMKLVRTLTIPGISINDEIDKSNSDNKEKYTREKERW